MPRNPLLICASAIFLAPCFAPAAFGQESSSKPNAVQPGPDAPSAALRDLLSAACAHDESVFVKFLTARNDESFVRLAPAARTELMKRFVLLDAAGKPASSADPAGRPIVRCTTPDGAAELQLGGAELRANLPPLPIELRDASELPACEPHHILLCLLRETPSCKILPLTILF